MTTKATGANLSGVSVNRDTPTSLTLASKRSANLNLYAASGVR